MKNKLIVPVVAAAAAALTYLFATEDGKELKDKIAKAIDEHLPEIGKHLQNFGAKIQDQLAGLSGKAEEFTEHFQG